MKHNELTHVRYTKRSGDVSERYIIPTFIPQQNIKAIDVTELGEQEREQVVKFLEQYANYYQQAINKVFSFEDWVSHTQNVEGLNVKWRTFNIDRLEPIE